MNNIEDFNLCKFNKKKCFFKVIRLILKLKKKNFVVSYKVIIINNKYFIWWKYFEEIIFIYRISYKFL